MLAEGIVHFGEDGTQAAIAVMAVPEADGIENVAEHTGKGLQPDLAVRGDTFACQKPLNPGQQRRAVARTMIHIVQGEEPEAVAGKHRAFDLVDLLQGDAEIEHGVAKAVYRGAQTAMHDIPETEAECRHDTATRESVSVDCCHGAAQPSAAATRMPERRPSSWKP